jgi:hypothetical protein
MEDNEFKKNDNIYNRFNEKIIREYHSNWYF